MRTKIGLVIVASFCLLTLSACGGGSNDGAALRPAPDFSLAISPSVLSVIEGGAASSPTTVSVTGRNGFTGPVTVAISGLPIGATATPASGFAVAAGASQDVTFSVPLTAPLGMQTITFQASSGGLSHSASITLTAEPMVTTLQEGSLLVLQTQGGNETSRVGLETLWGGSIVEVSLNGANFVNRHDTGREVQAALYDYSQRYDGYWLSPPIWGWDPVQGGDKYNQGSPLLDSRLAADSVYIKTQPYEWDPDTKGGGLGNPVLSDTIFEQTVSPVPGHARAFKVHYKLTHLGADQHANSGQELPAIYVNMGYERFVYYTGGAPWTNAPVSFATVTAPDTPKPPFYTPEQWGAMVDTADMGLTVYTPANYPYFGGVVTFPGPSGPAGDGTNYFVPSTQFSVGPNQVIETDLYVIGGDYQQARQAIYDIRSTVSLPDIMTPMGFVDAPTANATISGTVDVLGWTFDNVGIRKVEVFVDGALAGTATYGTSRPDVQTDFASAPVNCGYQFSLNTTGYANGSHNIGVVFTDSSGNAALMPRVLINVAN